MTFKIKDRTWKIKLVSQEEFIRTSEEKETFFFGQCDHVKQTIYILTDLTHEQAKQTLIHELTHAFMNVYGFGHITEQVPLEIMCDFVGCYAEEIVKIAEKF